MQIKQRLLIHIQTIMQIRPRLLINIHKSKGHRTLTSLQSNLTTTVYS